MKLKKIIALAMATVMTASMVACGSEKQEIQSEKTTLRVGVMGSIDAVPLVIAQQNGYFEEEGIDLDLQIFKAAKDTIFNIPIKIKTLKDKNKTANKIPLDNGIKISNIKNSTININDTNVLELASAYINK